MIDYENSLYVESFYVHLHFKKTTCLVALSHAVSILTCLVCYYLTIL